MCEIKITAKFSNYIINVPIEDNKAMASTDVISIYTNIYS